MTTPLPSSMETFSKPVQIIGCHFLPIHQATPWWLILYSSRLGPLDGAFLGKQCLVPIIGQQADIDGGLVTDSKMLFGSPDYRFAELQRLIDTFH